MIPTVSERGRIGELSPEGQTSASVLFNVAGPAWVGVLARGGRAHCGADRSPEGRKAGSEIARLCGRGSGGDSVAWNHAA
jgi:hypothetical protein